MIEAEYLRSILDYDPATGIFKWKVTRNNRTPVGMIAGDLSNGYIRISIDRKTYRAHRLAWLYVYGVWPIDEIDHINRVKHDNRIENLREATRQLNCYNIDVAKNNRLGVKGVRVTESGRYRATIRCNGRSTHLGMFTTIKEAEDAYNQAFKFLTGLLKY